MTEDWISTITTTKGIKDKQVKIPLLPHYMTKWQVLFNRKLFFLPINRSDLLNASVNLAWHAASELYNRFCIGSFFLADNNRRHCEGQYLHPAWYKTCWVWFMEQLNQTCLEAEADVSMSLLKSIDRLNLNSSYLFSVKTANRLVWCWGWHVFLYLY